MLMSYLHCYVFQTKRGETSELMGDIEGLKNKKQAWILVCITASEHQYLYTYGNLMPKSVFLQ